MDLTEELFVIPDKENFILYAPLKMVAMKVNSAFVKFLQGIKGGETTEHNENLISKLSEVGIIETDEKKENGREEYYEEDFAPVSVTLFPITDCNLRCIYCYASSGETNRNMNMITAKVAIDFIIQNALKRKNRYINIGFHGGGEPFLNFDFVCNAVEYSKEETTKRNLGLRASAATNGIFSTANLEWILKNMDYLNISIDGPEDIQNIQRPLKNGGPSYNLVMETIKHLEEEEFDYGIRATITNHNLNRMCEMVDFFRENTSLKSFHFEPVFECGRCNKTGTKEPNSETFLEKMAEAKEYATKKGIDVYYSGGKIGSAVPSFCKASGGNFYITVDGLVSSCLEITDDKDPRSDVFIYGKIDSDKVFIFQDRLSFLRSRIVKNIPFCSDCFAKYSCAGDCLAKVYSQSGNIFDTSNNKRCVVNRGLLLCEIKKELEGGKEN